jgi:hypothetical protein
MMFVILFLVMILSNLVLPRRHRSVSLVLPRPPAQ